MRNHLWSIAVVVVLAFVAFFSFSQIYLSAPRHGPDLSRSKLTERTLFLATITPENGEPKVGPLSSWMLTVRQQNGHPIRDAVVTVDGGMPDHDHGLPTAPTVSKDLGEGHYRIEGLKFTMPGLWTLHVKIATSQSTDQATFNVVL